MSDFRVPHSAAKTYRITAYWYFFSCQADKQEQEELLDKLAACQKEVDDLSDWFDDFKDDIQQHPENEDQPEDEKPDINAIQEKLVDNQVS